ncbi:pentapeptide repeat-containing protein [Psychrobacter celer]|uniref:pentapeptide repeat-containing protein n=1 Tax=Psychrobacter celer TaxID=306572 RepID=UPI003FD6BD86
MFKEANLEQADLTCTLIEKAVFEKAEMKRAILGDAEGVECDFSLANMHRNELPTTLEVGVS